MSCNVWVNGATRNVFTLRPTIWTDSEWVQEHVEYEMVGGNKKRKAVTDFPFVCASVKETENLNKSTTSMNSALSFERYTIYRPFFLSFKK